MTHDLPRLLRGVLGTAVAWATGWALVGAASAVNQLLQVSSLARKASEAAMFVTATAGTFAIAGACTGTLVALMIAFDARRVPFTRRRLRDVAAWGAAASLAVSSGVWLLGGAGRPRHVLSVLLPGNTIWFVALGAISAGAMLLVMRSSAQREASSPPPSDPMPVLDEAMPDFQRTTADASVRSAGG